MGVCEPMESEPQEGEWEAKGPPKNLHGLEWARSDGP